MNRSLTARIVSLLQRRHLKGTLAKIALTLSCLSIFLITYMLVAPVLTQEWEAICGIEEHAHTESCYEDVLVCALEETEAGHRHSDDCYELRGEDVLVCGQEESDGHIHSDSCYTEGEAILTCTEPTGGHTHTDGCYTVETVTRYKTVTEDITETVTVEDTETLDITDEEGNVIGAETVVTGSHEETIVVGTQEVEVEDGTEEVWTLTCGEEEFQGHEHDDSCYTTGERILTCAEEETEGHEHDDSCYERHEEKVLICTEEEAEGHEHGDGCYERRPVCGLEEHTHTDQCYNVPGEGGPKYTCGFLTEHTHRESCYFESGELKCTIAEHIHTDECTFETVTLDETFTAESEDGAVVLNLHVNGEVTLPVAEATEEIETAEETENTEETGFALTLTESEDMAIYEEYETLATEQGEVMMVQVLNYTLARGGYEVDLSSCEVTAEVTPTEAFEEMLNTPIEDFEEMLSTSAEIMTAAYELPGDEDGEAYAYSFCAYTEEEPGVVVYAVTRGQGADPSFTVQYYAHMERVVKEDYGKTKLEDQTGLIRGGRLPIIDTDGGGSAYSKKEGKLPKNNTPYASPGTPYRYESPNGNNIATLQLDGDGFIKTTMQLTEIYQEEDFTYQNAPGLRYFNILLTNEDSQYTLEEIWVLKDGKDEKSTDQNDWTIYLYTSDTRFTNRPETARDKENYILIDEGTVIRLVYITKSSEKNFPANFYDYDISDGKIYTSTSDATAGINGLDTSTQTDGMCYYANTKQQGINSPSNYTGSGAKLAFGNQNTSTQLGDESWKGYSINKVDWGSFMLCTFGLVEGLNSDGSLKYSDGVSAPKLFNGGTAQGKTYYDHGEYSLAFWRVGDTYTLTGVNGTSAQVLDKFEHPAPEHTHIWTNNFWPMDSASSYGADGHDLKFGGKEELQNRNRWDDNITPSDTLPVSDDGKDHNAYFGMQYAVEFNLSASYVGPLEYYFFGDDDMWVFLSDEDGNDTQLVCDIGGVHSSVGEYVNLWDYIDRSKLLNDDGSPKKVEKLDENGNKIQTKGKDGNLLSDDNGNPVYEMTDMVKTYKLSFFYTERGASGSTCWMQFTLPTVVGLDLDKVLDEQLEEGTGSISVEKVLDGVENTNWFTFEIDGLDDNYNPDFLLRDANGNLIHNDTIKADPNYIIGGDSLFRIRAGDVLVLRNLPEGAEITVTEHDRTGYHTTIEVDGEMLNEGKDADTTGKLTIEAGKRIQVVYTNIATYELPSTGGAGTESLYAAGVALILTAVCLMYLNQRRSRKAREGERA